MKQKLLPWHHRACLKVGWIWTFMLWNIHIFSELFLRGGKRAEPLCSTNYFCMCVPSRFSCLWLFRILCTVACQALVSLGFSRQDYLSGLPCPPPEYLPNPGSPALAGGFFITCTTWEALFLLRHFFFFFKDLFDVDHFFCLYWICYILFLLYGMWDLSFWPGIKPVTTALKVMS